ncbi:hypothetical protein MPH_09530 [Macrophomina phaseolina MS6]|uniref:Methyltransferase type 11 domain-containing protein n=1 Tax=Macrophomina phaseolina (strain MS6) TaxID=1126212 RepID=K2RSN9_MACPH|nr:hypothetical protein MPH_09530 [Macrophomina phaseolina MS6]
MDVPSNTFTHVLTNFGFVGIADPRRVLSEWRRVLRPAGVCGFTIWESVGWFPVVGAAVRSLHGPAFPTWKEFCNSFSATEEAWEERAFFEREIEAVGFEEVRVESFENQTMHASAKEFCEVYGGMCKVITEKLWSEEEKEKYGPELNAAIERALKEQHGDGEVVLDWKAWVVTAKAPAEK